MEYTSAEANKLLKKLNDVHQARLYEEEQCSTFLAAMGEEPESLRPEYDYAAAQEKLRELEEKIMTVKHALNLFNTTHTVPGFSMTIDRALVYLTAEPKTRTVTYRAKVVARGEFVVPAVFANAMYDDGIQAHGVASRFVAE